jgi:DNA transposition AAA+ family ATPase
MRSKIIPTSNISRLSEATAALLSRSPGQPGMGLIEGATGYGKTTATVFISIKVNAVFVRALASTTPSTLLRQICKELGVGHRPTNADTVELIVQRLAETGRPLFIDEADHLAGKKVLLETLRDLHDLSNVPVVLIGMKDFRRKITGLQQLTGRIAEWVEFMPATADDAVMLARGLCEVDVANDLVRKLHDASKGSIRNFVVGLAQVEKFARSRTLQKITLGEWPANKDFFVGTAPTSNRVAPIVAVA